MKQPTYYENGYALLIGIKYEHWAYKLQLQGCLNDIKTLQNHFIAPEKAGYNPKNIIALTEDKATAQGILTSLDKLADLCRNDSEASVLIYYSGHGETDGTTNFLVPYDFDLNKWRNGKKFDADKIVSSQQFTQKLDAINAAKCLIILDCCHAENMPTHKGIHDDTTAFLKGFTDDLNVNTITARSIDENISKGKGRVILTSCEAHEKSLDLGSNGLFTQVLLECLNGAENIEKDGYVRLIDMIRYIPKQVAARALTYIIDDKPHQQHPVFKRIENLRTEDFIICAYDLPKAKGIREGIIVPPKIDKKPSVDEFKEELYVLLEDEQQNAISDILIKIKASPYQYDKVLYTTLKGITPMQLALIPQQYVQSTKLLINSLK